MTEPAEHAKRSKLNMVIRLFACHCSLWRLKQAELKYQTRGEITCNSYDGGMSLEHVQELSFCGFFPIFTRVQKVYLCPLLPLPVFWDIMALWSVVACLLSESGTHKLETAMWKCYHVTAAFSWWPEQTAHCTPLNKRTEFYYHLEFCPALYSTRTIPVAWRER